MIAGRVCSGSSGVRLSLALVLLMIVHLLSPIMTPQETIERDSDQLGVAKNPVFTDIVLEPLQWISGSFLDANLPLSIGFINIPAFLIFIPITTFMARVGANTIHKVDKTKVQAFFGIFLFVVGTIFIYRFLNL